MNHTQPNPGDIDWKFTSTVNRRQKFHRLARFVQDAAVPALLLAGAMAFGWFARGMLN